MPLHMKSIIWTYPGFQTLPRGIKQMLVASESDFFSAAKPAAANVALGKMEHRQAPRLRVVDGKGVRLGAFDGAWKN
jgi:hypothetical protein